MALCNQRVLKADSEIQEPNAKLCGSPVSGDKCCIALIKSGETVNTFVLAFSQQVLAKALPESLGHNPAAVDKAARAAMQVTLKKVITQIGPARAQVLKSHGIDTKSAPQDAIKDRAGIVIPTSGTPGLTNVYAVWESKAA